MERIQLEVAARKETGSSAAQKMRRNGQIPGVVYGREMDPIPVAIDASQFSSVVGRGIRGNLLLDLKIKGQRSKGTPTAMVKEIQWHPITGDPLNVDFMRVSLTEKITTPVPVVLSGESPGQKEGGILEQVMHEVEVECLPTDTPEQFQLDISEMAIGDSLHVSDLSVPDNVEIVTSPDEAVAVMAAPAKEEEEVAPPAEEEMVEPEVLAQKGERPKEGEEGAPTEAAEESPAKDEEKKG